MVAGEPGFSISFLLLFLPPLFVRLLSGSCVPDGEDAEEVPHVCSATRGLNRVSSLFSPGLCPPFGLSVSFFAFFCGFLWRPPPIHLVASFSAQSLYRPLAESCSRGDTSGPLVFARPTGHFSSTLGLSRSSFSLHPLWGRLKFCQLTVQKEKRDSAFFRSSLCQCNCDFPLAA